MSGNTVCRAVDSGSAVAKARGQVSKELRRGDDTTAAAVAPQDAAQPRSTVTPAERGRPSSSQRRPRASNADAAAATQPAAAFVSNRPKRKRRAASPDPAGGARLDSHSPSRQLNTPETDATARAAVPPIGDSTAQIATAKPAGAERMPQGSVEAAASNSRKKKRYKPEHGIKSLANLVPEAQALDAPSASEAVGLPIADTERKAKQRERTARMTAPDEAAALRKARPQAVITDAPDARLGAGAASSEAGTLPAPARGDDDPSAKRSRKRKQRQAHAAGVAERSGSPEATTAVPPSTATDMAKADVNPTRTTVKPVEPVLEHEQADVKGGHSEQQPKLNRKKARVEQSTGEPPHGVRPEPHGDADVVPHADVSRQADDGDISNKQPRKRNKKQQLSPQTTNGTGPELVNDTLTAAAAHQEGRTSADHLTADQPGSRQAGVAQLGMHAAAGSELVPVNDQATATPATEGDAAVQRKAGGSAVPAAGPAAVAIHSDGPAWRDHATRGDIRSGRYSEAEKQTIRDAVAEYVFH